MNSKLTRSVRGVRLHLVLAVILSGISFSYTQSLHAEEFEYEEVAYKEMASEFSTKIRLQERRVNAKKRQLQALRRQIAQAAGHLQFREGMTQTADADYEIDSPILSSIPIIRSIAKPDNLSALEDARDKAEDYYKNLRAKLTDEEESLTELQKSLEEERANFRKTMAALEAKRQAYLAQKQMEMEQYNSRLGADDFGDDGADDGGFFDSEGSSGLSGGALPGGVGSRRRVVIVEGGDTDGDFGLGDNDGDGNGGGRKRVIVRRGRGGHGRPGAGDDDQARALTLFQYPYNLFQNGYLPDGCSFLYYGSQQIVVCPKKIQRNKDGSLLITRDKDRKDGCPDGGCFPGWNPLHGYDVALDAARNIDADYSLLFVQAENLQNAVGEQKLQLERALQALEANLYKTVLGNYIDSQIQKVMGNLCELVNICHFWGNKDVDKFKQTIDDLLRAPRGSRVEGNYKVEDGKVRGLNKVNIVDEDGKPAKHKATSAK